MALRQLRIGAVENAAQWDDGDFTEALETDQPIAAGSPVSPDHVLRLGDMGSRLLAPISTANISNPTELNSLVGVAGTLVLVYKVNATPTIDDYTLYAYDAGGPAVNAPYVMDASGAGTERWVAIAGKYNYFTQGDVVGPGASTDEGIARFDGITGKLLQDSSATVDNSGSMNIPVGQGYKVNGVKVVGAQQSAIASAGPISAIAAGVGVDTINLATFNTALTTLVSELNAVRDVAEGLKNAVEAHGLIAI